MSRIPPKVVVCMPVYNGAAYLAESIKSVLEQTYSDFQVIVSDDCSQDNTQEIVQSIRDNRLVYVRNSRNLGLVGNWNRCLALVESDYVYLWHQDDVMMPANLERKVEVLDNHAQVGFVHSNFYYINFEGAILSEHWVEESKHDYVCSGLDLFRRLITEGNRVGCASVMARTECYRRLGGFRIELPYACDYEMWMRLSLYYDVACLGQPLVKWRNHSTNESNRFDWTPRGREQELLARLLVLSSHGHRVEDAGKLRKSVKMTAGRQAARKAVAALNRDNFQDGWGYWWLAVKARPSLMTSPSVLYLLAKLLLGPVGIRIYRQVKRALVAKMR